MRAVIKVYYTGSVSESEIVFSGNIMPDHNLGALREMMSSLSRFPTVYLDEDHGAVLDLLEKDADQVKAEEVLYEKVRGQREYIDLLSIQIKLLRQARKKLKKQKNQKTIKSAPSDIGVDEIDEVEGYLQDKAVAPSLTQGKNFNLTDWQVYWTDRHFSRKEGDLIPISTESADIASAQLARVGRRRISIPAGSIIRVLEELISNPAAMEKALSSRLKFVPPEIKEWIKIKRGKDRILLLSESEQRRLIFFADGRDTIYRGI